MSDMPRERTLVFATNNQHKLYEVQELVGTNFKLLPLNSTGHTEDIPEDFDTLEENAAQKAWYIYNRYSTNCFADDTGLEVDALGGDPGVRSARYAGERKESKANIAKLLNELDGESNRAARFRTVVALVMNGEQYLFEGTVEGVITDAPEGNDGFGYDPIFRPNGYNETFAQMPLDEKNAISHRGRAIRKLAEYLLSLP